mgnify:CR=1 FL=1
MERKRNFMNICGDTHTHTLICQHAFSTLLENVAQAKRLGHRFLAATEHGPAMAAAPIIWYHMNLPRFVPQVLDGVVVLRGCEANVLPDGTLDLPESVLEHLDWVIASMHGGIVPEGLTQEEYTNIWLKVVENPYVDCIGHLGQEKFKPDYPTVIRAFRDHNKVVEINASSHIVRQGCEENCRQIVRLCKEYKVPLVLSSDAHFAAAIGQVDWCIRLVEEEGYPEDLVLNGDYERFRQGVKKLRGVELPE